MGKHTIIATDDHYSGRVSVLRNGLEELKVPSMLFIANDSTIYIIVSTIY